MAHGVKNKPFIFEGEAAEQYKKMRNKWIRLAIVGTGLPFVLPLIIGFFDDSLNFLELFGNGEIILSLFSINFPLIFDLFSMKSAYDDEYLNWAFWTCSIVVILQLAIYCSIRISTSDTLYIKSIISSVIMIATSWMSCNFAIKAMFQYSIREKGGEENA